MFHHRNDNEINSEKSNNKSYSSEVKVGGIVDEFHAQCDEQTQTQSIDSTFN